MITVFFTSHLDPYFPNLQKTQIDAINVKAAITIINDIYPGISNYLLDDQDSLKKHVKLYINNDFIEDEINLSDSLSDGDELHIMQALSGG